MASHPTITFRPASSPSRKLSDCLWRSTGFPGDIIIADDDGVVVVPLQLVDDIIAHAGTHKDWEVFSKLKLSEGGDLRKYYPLTEEAQQEFEEWKKTQQSGA